MKVLRKILSPKVLSAIILILELAIIGSFWFFLEYGLDLFISGKSPDGKELSDVVAIVAFIAMRVIMYIISALVFLRIINREENPEYKIPWISLMFLAPVITLTFYVVFVRRRMRNKDAAIVMPTRHYLKERQKGNEVEHNAILSEIEPQYRGVFQYLRNSTHLSVSKNNRLTYFKNGEEFFPDFIESLKKADKFIFIEFFIVDEGKWLDKTVEVLKEKAAQGVEVRLIYDDIGSAGKVGEDFAFKMQKLGIECHKFHPFHPFLSNTINNRDHRKIVVIDHKIGYTGGMNLADEYANEIVRFGYWKDTMVKVEGKDIRNLIATFLQNYDLTTFVQSNYDKYLNGDDYPEFDDTGYAFSFGDAPGPYQSYQQIGEQNYINLLNVATTRVDISTPYLICSYPLQRAVLAAAKRGVEVNLIVPGIPDKKAVYWMAKCQFRMFLKGGVNVYIYTPGFNHEKQMLVDDRLCFCGTINFDFRSLTHHFEDGMTFLDAPCLKEVREDFDDMIAKSEKVDLSYTVPGYQYVICALLRVFRVLL
ncbi:MAG: PLDc N-terminal domain-containing protein [Bacilli bacterium]|nr:PLDc N-terminal domain-containing protein [Bacilli bacterium]